MAEARRLGWLAKTVLGIGAVAVLGLVVLLVTVGRSRSLDHRVRALFTDTTKPDQWVDRVAWTSKRAALFRVTARKTLEVEEVWFGDEPTPEDKKFPDRLVYDDDRRLRGGDAPEPTRSIAMTWVLTFNPEPFSEQGGIALVESDVVYEGVTDPGIDGGQDGFYRHGSLGEVRARVAHVHELRLAFDEVKKRNRSDLVLAFLGSHAYSARKEVIDLVGEDSEQARAVFRAFLADDAQLDGHRDVIEAIGEMNEPWVDRELADHLEHELAYWTAMAPKLGADWMLDAPKEEPRVLRRHYSNTCATLYALERHHDESCREPLRRFLAFQKTLPPDGVPPDTAKVFHERLERSCRHLRAALGEP